MSISAEEKNHYLREAAIVLAREEFHTDRTHAGGLRVLLDGAPLCEVTENGGITYRNEDIDEPERIDAKDKVYEIVRTTAEYMRQMETAPFLKADGLEDGYKVLADFNDIVLAGKLIVRGTEINVQWDLKRDDFLSLTDIAKIKDNDNPRYIIQNWLRNRNTIEFLGVWETLYNPDFNRVEFDAFRSQAGLNSFVMTPQKWVDATGAIGIVSKAGRYGGTYAHKEIAFEFASWISVEFKLYLVKEFERLKTEEMKQLGWDIKRNLAKINYRIHTDAIKENLIPPELSARQISLVYANEADVLNMALFGMTAKQWRDSHPDLKGNIRDYANVSQLVCLSNLENLNAVFINEGISQPERLAKLNAIAISQMKVLTEDHRILQLDAADDTGKPE